jgi:hypothetical protein
MEDAFLHSWIPFRKNNMKTLKHFLGWLFGYCPYGGTCTPKRPFKKNANVMGSGFGHRGSAGGGGC